MESVLAGTVELRLSKRAPCCVVLEGVLPPVSAHFEWKGNEEAEGNCTRVGACSVCLTYPYQGEGVVRVRRPLPTRACSVRVVCFGHMGQNSRALDALDS